MKRAFIAVLACMAAGCFAFLLNGCETSPAQEAPEITPSAATVRIGEAVEFRASGGYEYEWSLQNETLGRLDTRRGNKVVYRSMYNPTTSNSALQILTVSSTITGSSGSTNTDSYVQTAEAYITHVSTNS